MEQAAMQSGARDTMGGADGSQQTSATAASWVINLCASMAPNQINPILVPGIDAYRVYQISRNEDGRQRYRLRIGFFDNQSEARELLTKLRELYPAAFVTSLCPEDQKFARGYAAAKPKRDAAPVLEPAKVEAVLTTPVPATPAVPAAARTTPAPTPAPAKPAAAPREPAAAAAKPAVASPKKPPAPVTQAPAPTPVPAPVQEAASAPVLTLDVEWESAPAPATAAKAVAADKATPFHVGRGVALPKVEFELLADDTPAELGHRPTVEPEETLLATARVDIEVAPAKTVRPPLPPKQLDPNAPLPSFDSTVTIRALTSEELEGENQEQWFVVQLAASEQPVNLETMPRLDIFTAYRLYSVATTEERAVIHSLRLGFFTESVSAEAVCGYLKTFFGSPKVVRISTAEQSRFSRQPQPKIFSDTASTTGQFIELSTPKPVTPIQLGPKSSPDAPQGAERRKTPRHDKDMAALEMKLMEEARLTETGIRRMEKNSLLSRLVDKLTK